MAVTQWYHLQTTPLSCRTPGQRFCCFFCVAWMCRKYLLMSCDLASDCSSSPHWSHPSRNTLLQQNRFPSLSVLCTSGILKSTDLQHSQIGGELSELITGTNCCPVRRWSHCWRWHIYVPCYLPWISLSLAICTVLLAHSPSLRKVTSLVRTSASPCQREQMIYPKTVKLTYLSDSRAFWLSPIMHAV